MLFDIKIFLDIHALEQFTSYFFFKNLLQDMLQKIQGVNQTRGRQKLKNTWMQYRKERKMEALG